MIAAPGIAVCPPAGGIVSLTPFLRPPANLFSHRGRDPGIPGAVKGKPLRALIVDDEPVARRVLREEMEGHLDVTVVGEADNGLRALEEISSLQPDVVLLDLQMPQMGGFEVIQRLQGGPHIPVIIIVTAYDQHAIRAFDAGAIDYLLKPVSQPRLIQALERARQLHGSRQDAAENLARLQELAGEPAAAHPRRVVGRLGEEYFLLNTAEVFAFQAEGEVVWIITARQRYLAVQNLRTMEEKLKSGSFRRVHRNALVNLDHVRKLSALSSNRWLITLNNGQEFIVSKRMAHNVRQLLTW